MTTKAILKLLSVAQVLDCTTNHVRRLILQGRLQGINIALGQRRAEWRVSEESLEEFLKNSEQGNKKEE